MFSKDIPKVCVYCQYGTNLHNGKHVLCHRKGIVTSDFRCKKFIYSPLKRIPKRKKNIAAFDISDFSIV